MADQDQLGEGDAPRSPRIEVPLIGMLVGGGGVLVISLVALVIYFITTRKRRGSRHPQHRHKKYHSGKKLNSSSSNCSPPNNGYDVIPQNKAYDVIPPNIGYDVIPLNRLKKPSDPDVVICIKSGNVSRRPSSKGLDIVPVQPQMEPLVNSNESNLEALERTSNCSFNDDDCCNDSTCGIEEHSCELQNSTPKMDAEQDTKMSNNSCWDGEYSEISFSSKPCGQNKTHEQDSSMHPTKSEDIYALGRNKVQRNKCSECDNCCEYVQAQAISHQNRKKSITSIESGSQRPQQNKATYDKLKNTHNEHHHHSHDKSKNHVLREELRAMIIETTDQISNDDDDIYEDTSHYSSTIVTIQPENDSPPTERKSKMWRSSLGGFLCSKSRSDSVENVKNLKKQGDVSHPDKSSTYQKFDGVYSYEFPLPDSAKRLKSPSQKGPPRNKLKREKETNKKATQFKGEFEDLLYISKAELDNLLNIEDNKKEQKILAGVSPLKDLLQQRESEKTNNRRSSKTNKFSQGNDATDLKMRLKNDKRNNRLKRESYSRSKERISESLDEHKIVTPNDVGIILHKTKPVDVRIRTPKNSNKLSSSKGEEKSAALGDSRQQISEPTISEFESGSNSKSSPLSEPQTESLGQSNIKSRSSFSNSTKQGGSTEGPSKSSGSKSIRIDPKIPPCVKTSKRPRVTLNPGSPKSSLAGDRRKYKSEGNSPCVSPAASKSILNVTYQEKRESTNSMGKPYLSRYVTLSTPEFEMDVQEGNKQPLRSILRHN